MTVTNDGLHLSDKELRSFMIMKAGLLNFSCCASCDECNFLDDEICTIERLSDLFDVLFKEMVL